MLAMLQTIPRELFAAAQIDGANRWQLFGRLVLPLIATETGPYYATFFLPHYIVDESFHMFKYGYGAAAAMILYFVTAFTIGMQFLLVEPE